MTIDPTDYLKYTQAEALPLLEAASDLLCGLEQHHAADDHEAQIENVLSLLDTVRAKIAESAAAFCSDGDDMNRYADGRPVTTRIDLETGAYFVYAWHPQPGHRDDRPRELGTVEQRDGTRKRVFIAGPGILDAVTTTSPLRVVK